MMDDPRLRDALRSMSEGNGAEHHLDLADLDTRVRRARRRRVYAAAGAASLAVAAVLTGSALVQGSDEPDLLQPADVPSVGADVRERAAEVYASFAGTERQQDAGFVLRAYGQNGAMDACLDEKGFPEWDWSLTRVYSTPKDPLSYGTWFTEPNRPILSAPHIAHRARILAEEEMNRDDIPPAEDAAIRRCITLVDDEGLPEDEVEATARSASAAKLVDAWATMVRDASDKVADASPYLRCMEEARIPVLDDNGTPASEMWEGFSTLGPSNGKIPSSASDALVSSEEWQSFLAEERVITDADWDCRKGVYTQHIDDLIPAISQFEADHGQEIERARQEWVVIEDQARELGYTGQLGPLGR